MSSTKDDTLSIMDMLDLDEGIVNTRLRAIMSRKTFGVEHMQNVVHLLRYKYLINTQEGTDCENAEEFEFVIKLIPLIDNENAEVVCKIINISLSLNPGTICAKAEHLIQQLLCNVNLTPGRIMEENESTEMLYKLKVIDSILDAVVKENLKVSLPFLEISLEQLLIVDCKALQHHFLTFTVEKMVEGVDGYNVLDKMWTLLEENVGSESTVLTLLTSLSSYYLPLADSEGVTGFKSTVVLLPKFWETILLGLKSEDVVDRKMSLYLAKRGIDNLKANVCDSTVLLKDGTPIFTWTANDQETLEEVWKCFFVLIESLEEKQSNIVLPSLQLFNNITALGLPWRQAALERGLQHEAPAVVLACLHHRLLCDLSQPREAAVLLTALNIINMYDASPKAFAIKTKLKTYFSKLNNFKYILLSFCDVKWSPVPLFHLTSIFSELELDGRLLDTLEQGSVSDLVYAMLKLPCNNVEIREAVYCNILSFVCNSCTGLHWKNFARIIVNFPREIDPSRALGLKICWWIKRHFIVAEQEKLEFWKLVTGSYTCVDFVLLYLFSVPQDISNFLKFVDYKLRRIKGINSRQYARKEECAHDFFYLSTLFKKTSSLCAETQIIYEKIRSEFHCLLSYLLNLLPIADSIHVEDLDVYLAQCENLFSLSQAMSEFEDFFCQIYKSALCTAMPEHEASEVQRLFCIKIINYLTPFTGYRFKRDILRVRDVLDAHFRSSIIIKTENQESFWKLKNRYNEAFCELVYGSLICENVYDTKHDELLTLLEEIVDWGGYGCLIWALKIFKAYLTMSPMLWDEDVAVDFDVPQFLHRLWKEVEESKSSAQFLPCIKAFIAIITDDALLKILIYNNHIICFCLKIIEFGSVSNTALCYLIEELRSKENNVESGALVYTLCEVLLFCAIPRKDQRLTDAVVKSILEKPEKFTSTAAVKGSYRFNHEIQNAAINILLQVQSAEVFKIIRSRLMAKVEVVLKNKQRYHAESRAHRVLLAALQHLLLLVVLRADAARAAAEESARWAAGLLLALPHPPSVRLCLQWHVALYFILKNKALNHEALDYMNLKTIPPTSLFVILYWVMKHRIKNKHENVEAEWTFTMDLLLAHTMGQKFSVRLQAQFLASKLYQMFQHDPVAKKYEYIYSVIQQTFSESSQEKSYVKMQQDCFLSEFDVVENLTPHSLYYSLPRCTEVAVSEMGDLKSIPSLEQCRNYLMRTRQDDAFTKHWLDATEAGGPELVSSVSCAEVQEGEESMDSSIIQKKYIPWKDMSDIDSLYTVKKRDNGSGLIVVASLIDKLPNLGGLARTCEVFGARTYVIDSLRHLQDKKFQGLSVSAERWVDVEEVRPGAPLKEYLLRMRAEGYSIVAAEQTSSSLSLDKFQFPYKTVLLLGHEKEGVSCALLPLAGACVAVPQRGLVRSLNVHVTAALFLWEYTRQHLL